MPQKTVTTPDVQLRLSFQQIQECIFSFANIGYMVIHLNTMYKIIYIPKILLNPLPAFQVLILKDQPARIYTNTSEAVQRCSGFPTLTSKIIKDDA
jgi:hypothetical protein